jgi:hypothetical protein
MEGCLKLGKMMIFLSLLAACLFSTRPAQAQAQRPAFFGTFTLPYEVRLGGSVLPPGRYSISIKSTGSPMIALVRTADGNAVTYVVSGSVNTHSNTMNALLIREDRGQFVVHSLALADLGLVLIYDPSLAKEPVQEARQERSLPILSAKN